MDPKHPAHGPDAKLFAMRPDEGVLHWDSRAKYAVAFFRISRSSVTRVNSRFRRRFSASWSTTAFCVGSPNSFSHLYREYGLTPNRRDTSRTGYPRTVI